ncbi:MAG: hypothetical protein WD491_05525, partial [Balneolales bacterium]
MNKFYSLILLVFILFLNQSFAQTQTHNSGVSIQQGPTPIPNGDALDQDDITLQNEKFAVSFSVSSRPPWGVARGGILDLAIIEDG